MCERLGLLDFPQLSVSVFLFFSPSFNVFILNEQEKLDLNRLHAREIKSFPMSENTHKTSMTSTVP